MTKKTIRDIHITKKAPRDITPHKEKPTETSSWDDEDDDTSGYTYSYQDTFTSPSSTKKKSGVIWWIIGILGIGIIGFHFFARAVIHIEQQTATYTGSVSFTAVAEGTEDTLGYETITLQDTLERTVSASEAHHVEEKASGNITIFNGEKTAQKFIEETRFETPDGLIFKLGKGVSVTVPPASNGKPGTATAVVYAEKPGDQYNIQATKFVIPGWRESKSPKFKTQYAQSSTPMTGGFIGEKKTIDPNEERTVRDNLQTVLRDRLIKEASAQIPADFVFFPALADIAFTPTVADHESQENAVRVVENATLSGIILSRNELAMLMAQKALGENYHQEPITVTNLSELSVKRLPGSTSDSVSFTIEGTSNFLWNIDTMLLEEKVKGASQKDFDTILRDFSGVKSATLRIYPPWKRTVPEKIIMKISESQ